MLRKACGLQCCNTWKSPHKGLGWMVVNSALKGEDEAKLGLLKRRLQSGIRKTRQHAKLWPG